jgi:hypothetical protein
MDDFMNNKFMKIGPRISISDLKTQYNHLLFSIEEKPYNEGLDGIASLIEYIINFYEKGTGRDITFCLEE